MQDTGGGEGVLPYMGYIGICCCEGYGFSGSLLIKLSPEFSG